MWKVKKTFKFYVENSENNSSFMWKVKKTVQVLCRKLRKQFKFYVENYIFVGFDSLRPINNLSVIKGRVFLS